MMYYYICVYNPEIGLIWLIKGSVNAPPPAPTQGGADTKYEHFVMKPNLPKRNFAGGSG